MTPDEPWKWQFSSAHLKGFSATAWSSEKKNGQQTIEIPSSKRIIFFNQPIVFLLLFVVLRNSSYWQGRSWTSFCGCPIQIGRRNWDRKPGPVHLSSCRGRENHRALIVLLLTAGWLFFFYVLITNFEYAGLTNKFTATTRLISLVVKSFSPKQLGVIVIHVFGLRPGDLQES